MLTELDILKDVTVKLEELGIQYMLTGSLAMSYYSKPRMTRDIDLVVNIPPQIVVEMEKVFKKDYYISIDSIKDALLNEFVFNLIHTQSAIKVDCIVRKNENYRVVEFDRRRKIKLSDFEIFIVSKEDLIISKLIWFKDSNSDIQKEDVQNLLKSGTDKDYLINCIIKLDLSDVYEEVRNE